MFYDNIKCPVLDCEEVLEILGDNFVCPVHGEIDDYDENDIADYENNE